MFLNGNWIDIWKDTNKLNKSKGGICFADAAFILKPLKTCIIVFSNTQLVQPLNKYSV